ncbi:hypothetical protein HRR83_000449 [Exophiala dermatitidis]|nr:hypothetical protein HRR74_000451 [Exophiala dermatitidis]KAJ4528332.1 hypothetical protein HRR73_000955 [Exophiala dermatitidis]KAJ4607233.1 hypothetical protein HRR84_000537 [Exophiala dermatitidis]KAJ4608225.1 hypothetical protein HRR83_000449 [Exophiala dermatitidis]KAJ4634519.1 hypothetical protein HRR88_000450 [Exophiala dermatitidis]
MASLTSSEVRTIVADADGDLILEVGKEHTQNEETKADLDGDLILEVDKEDGQGDENEEGEVQEQEKSTPKMARILVSTKVLTLSSPVFKTMLSGNFREAQLPFSKESPPILRLPEDAPGPTGLLCRVLHYDNEALQDVSFDGIYALATVSDKYDYSNAIKPLFRQHLYSGRREITMYDWIHTVNTAYLFNDEDAFYRLSQSAVQEQHFIDWLFDLYKAKMDELHHSCHRIICMLLGVRSSQASQPFRLMERSDDNDDDKVEVPRLCVGQAMNAANLFARLCAFGHCPGRLRVSVNRALRDLGKVIDSFGTGNTSQCAPELECAPCSMNWTWHMREAARELEEYQPGVCLRCLKASVRMPDYCPHTSMHDLLYDAYWRISGEDPSSFNPWQGWQA